MFGVDYIFDVKLWQFSGSLKQNNAFFVLSLKRKLNSKVSTNLLFEPHI